MPTKSIFIDTKNQTITPIDIDGYMDLRKAIEGSIEELPLGEFPGTVWVNEEGLINGTDYFFAFLGHPAPIAGNAVIQGEIDDQDDTMDVSITLAQAAQCVRFLTPEQVADWVEANAYMPAVTFRSTNPDGSIETSTIAKMGDVYGHMRRDMDADETDPDEDSGPK